jgi:hypothetical protein
MPVNYTPPTADALRPVPGIRLGTAAVRIKNWDRDDVLLVVAEPGTVATKPSQALLNRLPHIPFDIVHSLGGDPDFGGEMCALGVQFGNRAAEVPFR